MGAIKRFEDIQAWQKARALTKEIYEITSINAFAKDFGLKDQIRRASVSIMLNMAEGFARKTDREFKQFLVQAHGSTAEVQAALYVALDQKYISQLQFNHLYSLAEEISRMIMKFSLYLSRGKSGEK
jgi:four helix bundle protein